jgi:hypothetical protein
VDRLGARGPAGCAVQAENRFHLVGFRISAGRKPSGRYRPNSRHSFGRSPIPIADIGHISYVRPQRFRRGAIQMLAALVAMSVLTSVTPVQNVSADAAMQRKLILAERYAGLTHRQKLTDDVAIRQLKMAWSSVASCGDEKCSQMLDADIKSSVNNASLVRQRAEAKLLAEKLTEDELQAAIAFVQSPQGEAIIAVENGMANDLARIGHEFSQNVNASIYQSFCSQEKDACARMKAGSAAKVLAKP